MSLTLSLWFTSILTLLLFLEGAPSVSHFGNKMGGKLTRYLYGKWKNGRRFWLQPKKGNFFSAWVASHQENTSPASQWNNRADELARIAPLQNQSRVEDQDRLLEWLHIKKGHTEAKELYQEAHTQGWPVTQENCKTSISACGECHTRFE